jgi:hypothetical protein
MMGVCQSKGVNESIAPMKGNMRVITVMHSQEIHIAGIGNIQRALFMPCSRTLEDHCYKIGMPFWQQTNYVIYRWSGCSARWPV